MDDNQSNGDVARKRAEHLKDATKRARQLRMILEQADALKETGFDAVWLQIRGAAKVAADEASKFPRTLPPEPRRRDDPDKRPSIHLFVDESGQADDVREFDKDNDFFTLGAIAISDDAHEQYRTRAEQLKRKFFKEGPSVILHASELREAMKGSAEREGKFALKAGKSWLELVQALEELVEQTEFTSFGIIIQKWVFFQEFIGTDKDPFLPVDTYDLALHLLLERFERFVASLASTVPAPLGSITLESQNPERDARHQLSIAETIAEGTRWVSPEPLQRNIQPGAEFLRKQPSHPLELSDLLANLLYQLARDDFDKSPRLQQGGSTQLWQTFCDRFYQEGDLRQGKFGLKVFPTGRLDGWLDQFRAKWRRET